MTAGAGRLRLRPTPARTLARTLSSSTRAVRPFQPPPQPPWLSATPSVADDGGAACVVRAGGSGCRAFLLDRHEVEPDPRLRPRAQPDAAELGCVRVDPVCAATQQLRDRAHSRRAPSRSGPRTRRDLAPRGRRRPPRQWLERRARLARPADGPPPSMVSSASTSTARREPASVPAPQSTPLEAANLGPRVDRGEVAVSRRRCGWDRGRAGSSARISDDGAGEQR